MKKQIFSLLLSAAIFTTSPLFAMDPEEKPETSSCLICTKALMETDTEDQDKGTLYNTFSDEMIAYIITEDPHTTAAFSTASRTNYNFCLAPVVWTSLARNEFVHINPLNCAKEQFQKYWCIFKNQKIKIKKSDILEPYKRQLYAGACFTPTRDPMQVGIRQATSPVTHELGDIFSLLDHYAYVKCEGVYDENEPASVQLKAYNERQIISRYSLVLPYRVANASRVLNK